MSKIPCPCCGHLTLDDEGGFEICPVCFWEDNGQGKADANVISGGPNKDLSLTKARENFLKFGASHEEFMKNVRPPTEDEIPKL